MADTVDAVDAVDAVVALTARELLVLQLLARGYTDAQIARLLRTDAGEVERCRSAIQQRLHVHHVNVAIAFAIRCGLIS